MQFRPPVGLTQVPGHLDEGDANLELHGSQPSHLGLRYHSQYSA